MTLIYIFDVLYRLAKKKETKNLYHGSVQYGTICGIVVGSVVATQKISK